MPSSTRSSRWFSWLRPSRPDSEESKENTDWTDDDTKPETITDTGETTSRPPSVPTSLSREFSTIRTATGEQPSGFVLTCTHKGNLWRGENPFRQHAKISVIGNPYLKFKDEAFAAAAKSRVEEFESIYEQEFRQRLFPKSEGFEESSAARQNHYEQSVNSMTADCLSAGKKYSDFAHVRYKPSELSAFERDEASLKAALDPTSIGTRNRTVEPGWEETVCSTIVKNRTKTSEDAGPWQRKRDERQAKRERRRR
ncbi:hypothetical protein IAT40_005950 [Kwoniella sp. CBS 6097]